MPYADVKKKREQVRRWKLAHKEQVVQQVRRHQWRAKCEKNGIDVATPMPDGWTPFIEKKPKEPSAPPKPRAYVVERSEKMGIPIEEYSKQKWIEYSVDVRERAKAERRMQSMTTAREAERRRRQAVRQWLWDYKSTRQCERCGFAHPAALQFHHLRDKFADVSSLSTITAIKEEIEKCILLCANCHAVEHCKRDPLGVP